MNNEALLGKALPAEAENKLGQVFFVLCYAPSYGFRPGIFAT